MACSVQAEAEIRKKQDEFNWGVQYYLCSHAEDSSQHAYVSKNGISSYRSLMASLFVYFCFVCCFFPTLPFPSFLYTVSINMILVWQKATIFRLGSLMAYQPSWVIQCQTPPCRRTVVVLSNPYRERRYLSESERISVT